MDVLTPRGQESRKWEDRAIQLWSSHYKSMTFIHTPKEKPAAIDGIIIKDQRIIGVVETKARPSFTLEEFKSKHDMQWLVTKEKVDKCLLVAEILSVPFIGFLYMPQDDLLLYRSLWNPKSGWLVDIKFMKTKTQATINGGVAWRENAFIDMRTAKILGQT